jgi:hypothetical protein
MFFWTWREDEKVLGERCSLLLTTEELRLVFVDLSEGEDKERKPTLATWWSVQRYSLNILFRYSYGRSLAHIPSEHSKLTLYYYLRCSGQTDRSMSRPCRTQLLAAVMSRRADGFFFLFGMMCWRHVQ